MEHLVWMFAQGFLIIFLGIVSLAFTLKTTTKLFDNNHPILGTAFLSACITVLFMILYISDKGIG